jgi:hypothetical protein
MGSPLSPPLAVLICMMYKVLFKENLGSELRIRVRRYIDDVWVVGKWRRGDGEGRRKVWKQMERLRNGCYHERMIIESEGLMKRVDFLECRIERRKRWSCKYWSKNMARKERKKREMRRYTEYNSYRRREKIELVMGALTRVKMNSNEVEGVLKGWMEVIRDMRRAGYLEREIRRRIVRMEKKKRGGVCGEC